jgi:exodeoxyribonuclease I
MSLVFYTTKPTGEDVFFDQLLEFAAIRTDEELQELDRLRIRCRLLPHVIPAPDAMLASAISVAQLTDRSYPSHYEMVRQVRDKLLSWSPTLFIGWDSLELHDGFLRHALYKTLHNPYLTNTNGNCRSDAKRIAQACSIFAPGAIAFPRDGDGCIDFRLAQICCANGIEIGTGRDAIQELQAVVSLCSRMMRMEPDLWSNFMRFSTKAAVVEFINSEQLFCVNAFYYNRPHSCIVTTIGQSRGNSAEWFVYDLSVDPRSLLTLRPDDLITRLAQYPKPVRRLKSNGAPMIASVEDAPVMCRGRAIGSAELGRRASILHANQGLRERLISSFESLKEKHPPPSYVEQKIYESFVNRSDEVLMEMFHDAPWSGRLKIIDGFHDARLRTIGTHLIYLEEPEALDTKTRQYLDVELTNRVLSDQSDLPWLTMRRAREQIAEMLRVAPAGAIADLLEYQRHLQSYCA